MDNLIFTHFVKGGCRANSIDSNSGKISTKKIHAMVHASTVTEARVLVCVTGEVEFHPWSFIRVIYKGLQLGRPICMSL